MWRVGPNISTVTDVKSELQRQYPKQFEGVGKLNTKQISLHMDESVADVAQPLRHVLFHRREALEQKNKAATRRYNRLIFGVAPAREQYQHEIAMALAGIEGVENVSEDMTMHRP